MLVIYCVQYVVEKKLCSHCNSIGNAVDPTPWKPKPVDSKDPVISTNEPMVVLNLRNIWWRT